MALVDYTSESDSEAEEPASSASAPAAKRQKTSGEPAALLPPLPDAFHDLYAATVRVSTSDDPALHQGRKRVNPHKPGNWPSHLYIEWHPPPAAHAVLSGLLADLQAALSPLSAPLTSFLTSDLGAPLPLHVSLSRPLALATPRKDAFLEQLAARVARCGVPPFELAPWALEWHRTAESERSFLVLRVRGVGGGGGATTASASTVTAEESSTSTSTSDKSSSSSAKTTAQRHPHRNPDLSALLRHCNALARAFQQPPLYAFADGDGGEEDAFHISIAWSFAAPTAEVRARTARVFGEKGVRDAVLAMRVPVRGIKAKIGNVVTHVGLPERGRREGGVGMG